MCCREWRRRGNSGGGERGVVVDDWRRSCDHGVRARLVWLWRRWSLRLVEELGSTQHLCFLVSTKELRKAWCLLGRTRGRHDLSVDLPFVASQRRSLRHSWPGELMLCILLRLSIGQIIINMGRRGESSWRVRVPKVDISCFPLLTCFGRIIWLNGVVCGVAARRYLNLKNRFLWCSGGRLCNGSVEIAIHLRLHRLRVTGRISMKRVRARQTRERLLRRRCMMKHGLHLGRRR